MTLAEFKAWFEGFTESMSKAPNEAQWKRIKARVKEIDGTATTERIFVDRYWPTVRPYWYPSWIVSGTGGAGSAVYYSNTAQQLPQNITFSATTAMADLGRADAQSISSS